MTGDLSRKWIWLPAALLCAALLSLPVGIERETVFWGMLAALGLGYGLRFCPWPVAVRAGSWAVALLAPVCLLLLSAGLAAKLADKAFYVYFCGLKSPIISEIMEGREIVKAWLLTQNQGIYSHLQEYPLLITLYGPLYYILSAISSVWFGPGVFASRLVSVASGVALGLVTGAVVRKRCNSLWAGIVSGFVALLTPGMAYAAHARPDVLVWLTFFAGVLFLLRSAETPRRMGASFWMTGLFFVLAAFSKQQTWVYILAGIGFCLWRRELRPLGWRFGAVVAAGCLLCLGLAQWFTEGEFIRQTVVFPKRMSGLGSYNSFASAGERFLEFARTHWALLVAYLFSLALRRSKTLELMDVLFLAGLVSMVMVMRWWGSSVNHFLVLALFMIIECGVCLGRLLRGKELAWAVAVFALIAPPRFAVSIPTGEDPCGHGPDRKDAALLEARLESLKGPVIMDAEGSYVFLGKPVFSRLKLYDAFETDFYDQTGLWDLLASPLARDIKGRKAAAFVDSKVFMSQDLAGVVRSYYQEAERIGRYTVFTPRPDMAICEFPGMSAQPEAGSCMESARTATLKDWGKYLQPSNGGGELVLTARSGEPMGSFSLVYYPRFTGPGQKVRLSYSEDGSSWLPLEELAYDGRTPGTGFENRREAGGEVSGRSLWLRFELIGDAQLWATPRQPVCVYLNAPNLTEKQASD